jgi:hypothetical protein
MSRFAENTQVGADRSRAEIEKTLTRYGADSFCYGWQGDMAVLGFRMANRNVRFTLPMPDKDAAEFRVTPGGRRTRNDAAAYAAWEQATRQRWRALALVVKAKLEAVESGITTFEEEFLAHIVLPGGQTVGDWSMPQLEKAYATGKVPALMPGVVA